jgi:hypothetical protein
LATKKQKIDNSLSALKAIVFKYCVIKTKKLFDANSLKLYVNRVTNLFLTIFYVLNVLIVLNDKKLIMFGFEQVFIIIRQ